MSNKGVISNINLNNNSSYSIASTATAICSTAANTKVKAASIVNSESGSLTDFTLIDGLTINVFFENTNTADSPTLNINDSGQRFIYKFNTSNTNITWKAGSVLALTYFSDQEKEGWWINGEYDVAELYKITVTYSDNKYSSDKNYEDILAAYNSGDKFIYLSSGDDIYPLVSKGQVSFNFENATDTGLSKFVIRLDEPQQQDEDYTTGVYYKFVKFTSTAADTLNSGDKLVINRTTSIGNYSYSENLTSPITFGSNSSQYLANNGTWQNIPNHANDIGYLPYNQHDWPYGDPQDVQIALDDLAARKTGTADVQVNGASILNSGVANLITNTAYNASSNKLATMSDISAATSGVGDVKINGVSILSGGEANIITHGTYNASSNKIATMSDLPGNFGADEIMYSTSLQEWSSIRPAGDPTDVEQALEALAQYTVDHDGTITSITAGTGLTGGTITSSGTIALGTSGVTAGTYQGITVDKYGRVTSASDQNYLTSYTETDPTVPAWAKASSKPTYTASEVGALPDSTTIPSKTSDLTNDSGFITSNSISFKSGDTYTISTGRLILPGFIGTRSSSTGKATIYLNLELPKSYGNLSINISSMSGYIRGIVGYLTGSAALDFPALAISDPTNYTFTVTKMPPNRLQIEINCAVADVTSQTPVVFCSQNSGTRLAISFS